MAEAKMDTMDAQPTITPQDIMDTTAPKTRGRHNNNNKPDKEQKQDKT